MKSPTGVALIFFLCASALTSGAPVSLAVTPDREPGVKPRKHLKRFSSEAELKSFLEKMKKRGGSGYGSGTGSGSAPGDMANQAAVSTVVEVTSSSDGASAGASITNTQHAGVDEGGIVKMHNDHLVVLRRGRLFTVAIGGDALRPVSMINAFGPGIDPSDAWYDEMLISGDNIVVIGYSYERGGTEIGLFKIERDGKLRYRSTYHLRSNDYYSSRNYSSRLIGDKLIFYSPLYLEVQGDDVFDSFPALRRWRKGATAGEFRRIVSARSIYRALGETDVDDELALHTVTSCDVKNTDMTCDAVSVMGPPGRVFYVSPKSVYVWASDWWRGAEKERNRSMLFRIPLGGSAPSALRVSGSPVDQFSFLESDGKNLNVLVRSESSGDGMWDAEVSAGEIALLRVSGEDFADGSTTAAASRYQELEKVSGYTFQNRFVGDHLLYGLGRGWDSTKAAAERQLYAVNWKTGARSTIPLSHSVDRIDALATDGIIVGSSGNDLHFTSVKLTGQPRVVDTHVVGDAAQGETRSQGFFYKPDGPSGGVLGLPIADAGRSGYEQLSQGSAFVIFLRNDSLRFRELGRLGSGRGAKQDDACEASCVDWYGNARPIFAGGRVFALLGYEIVEGSLGSDRISELRRADFSPRSATR